MHSSRTVLLLCVDGMRPDGLRQAAAPHIHGLMQRGAYTLQARTVMPSVTLPCHISMLRGVTPERHGITSNVWTPLARPVPSVIDLVSQAGGSTASFYSWEQLRDLANPGSLDFAYYTRNVAGFDSAIDRQLAQAAAHYLEGAQPDLLFIHLDATDGAGHRYGWMSPEYLAAIGAADAALGLILQALEQRGRLERTVILVQSDHGGHAQSHGTDLPEDMTIPWVLAGPGVRVNHPLETAVHITDTAATIAHLLGIPPHRDWSGRPIMEALTW